MRKVMLRLHGDFTGVEIGDNVTPDTWIGTASNHAPSYQDPHDHMSIHYGEWNAKPTIKELYRDKPWYLQDPRELLDIKKDPNARFAFAGWQNGVGGYDYLEQTPYNWYLGVNPTLHDGLDLYAPKGSDLYSGVYGTVVDKVNDGTTYLLIEISENNEEPMKWQFNGTKWWYGNSKNWKTGWFYDKNYDAWFWFDNNGYLDEYKGWWFDKSVDKWMYSFGNQGYATNDSFNIDGKIYSFGKDGYCTNC